MATPALLALALRYGLRTQLSHGLTDEQLHRFIRERRSKGVLPTMVAPPPTREPGGNLIAKPKKVVVVNPGPFKPGKFLEPTGNKINAPVVIKTPKALEPTGTRINTRSPEAVRRQTLLRSRGYAVVVDGIWGPRSQEAWRLFKKHQPPPAVPKANLGTPGFLNTSAEQKRKNQLFQNQSTKTQQQIERDQAVKDRKAASLAALDLKKQRTVILHNAAVIRQSPKAAAKMTLGALTAALTDKEANFDLATSGAAAMAIQYHLQAHGYSVKLTGVPDQQTFKVLKQAYADVDRRAKRKRLNAIYDQVYAPLGLKPGAAATRGFPLPTVPTLAEMDAILQRGGFVADTIMRYFNRNVVSEADAWDVARWRQLEWIAEKRSPLFAGVANSKIFQDPSKLDIITALTAPFDYVGSARDDPTRPKFTGRDATLAQYKGQLQWDSQLQAVLTSTSPEDMKKKLLVYDAANEEKFKAKQAELAKHKSFWGKTFDAILWPGEMAYTAGQYATLRIIQEDAQLFGLDSGKDFTWKDTQILLGYAKPEDFPDSSLSITHRASHWITVPGSLIVDPLNFVAPFKIASTAARFGRGASALGHYGVETGGLFGKTLVYQKGTWSKAALARQIPGAVALEGTRSGQSALNFGKKLVEDKERALAAVRGRVSQAARHSFAPANTFAKKAIKVKTPRNIAEVQANKAAVRGWLEDPSNPEAQGILQELKDAKASLYLDAPRSTGSNVGMSFLANMAEKIRVLASHQFASDEALRLIDTLGYDQLKQDTNAAFEAVKQAKADVGYDEIVRQTNEAFEAVKRAKVESGFDEAEFSRLQKYTTEAFANYRRTKSPLDLRLALAGKAQLDAMREPFQKLLDEAQALNKKRKTAKDLFKAEEDHAHALNERRKILQGEIVDAVNDVVEAAGVYIKGGALKEGGQLYARQLLNRTLQKMDVVEDTIIPVLQDIIEDWADEAFEAAKKARAAGGEAPVGPGAKFEVEAASAILEEYRRLEVAGAAGEHRVEAAFGPPDWDVLGPASGPNWQEWSRARGYTQEEIDDFQKWLDLNKKLGITEPDDVFVDAQGRSHASVADETIIEHAHKAIASGEFPLEDASRLVDDAAAGAADDLTHPLWDENGLWAGRNGAEADALRQRAARAFAEENLASVKNPAHDIGHTGTEMAEAIEFEVKRGLPRIFNFAHREAMRLGDEFTFDANAAADKLEKEIISSWEQRPDGLFYDTRPEIKVNKLYARNYKEVADSLLDDLHKYLSLDDELDLPGLERLAAYGPKGITDGFDDSWNSLLWQLGSRFKSVPGMETALAEDTTRVKHGPRAPEHITNEKARIAWFNKETQRLGAFASAVAKYRVSLAEASDEVLPGELAKNLLFMRALAVHQSKWAKAAYLALNGFLKIWKFATLPLRPGWVVRNTVDNFAKAMVASVRDPRMLLLGGKRPGAALDAVFDLGHPGSAVRTVFDIGVAPLRGAIRLFDGLFNTKALDEFDKIMEIFWQFPADILTKFFDLAALPAPPPSVLDASRFSKQLDDWRVGRKAVINVPLDDYAKAGVKPPLRLQKASDKRAYELMMNHGDTTAAQRLAYKMRKTPDVLWDLMGNRPENYFKRVIYRSELKKEKSRLAREGITGVEAQMLAHEKAWDVVTETLFDYGKVSVVEDNLRVFMPFIQFWRKNTAFWIQNGVSKPWLPLSVLKLDQQRREAHSDLPEWMQRYFHVNEVVDAAGVVPGLDTLIRGILPTDAMIDPTSFLSFAPLHRVFRDLVYGDNQLLPPDEKARGIAGMIIGPIVRAMDEWGLGLNPIVRKPMEVAGIIDNRDWQAVFPQTTLAEAFTLKFFGEHAMFKLAQWERVFTLGEDVHAKELVKNFEIYVNREMVGQRIRGEPMDRAKAEATVRGTIYMQGLWNYFGGTYWRHASPEDIYVAKLQDDLRKGQIDFDNLPDKVKEMFALWSRTTGGAEAFDRYLANLTLIQAFYREPDFNERAEMIKAHPALAEYVNMKPTAQGIGKNWMKNTQRYTDTARYFKAVEFADAIDVPPDLRKLAYDMFVTPDLKTFWERNDTPKQIRDRMVRGEIYRSMKALQDAYFKIPDNDYEAKDGFLKEHPELVRHWNKHNSPSDNYEAIMGATKADLRNLYFEVLETKGFGAAAPILKQFPFMFEGTKSEKKIKDGEWIVGYGKKGWTDARRKDWKQVASFSHWFFNSYVKKVGFDKAYQWLRDSKDPRAKQLLDYFDKYPSTSGKSGKGKGWTPEHREAWGKVADFAKWFFDDYAKRVGEDKAFEWLYDSNDPKAKALVSYFRKYPSGESKSSKKWKPGQKQDWIKVSDFSKWFFNDYMKKVGEEKAFDWLYASDDPKAKALVAYFRKYPSDRAGKKPKPGWTPARYAAWAKVAEYSRWFFDTQMKKLGKDKAFDWLYSSNDPKAKALVAYFNKFPSTDKSDDPSKNWSPERKAHWAKVAKFSRWFHDFYVPKVGEQEAYQWLRKQTDATARQYMAYVDKYSTKEGNGKFSAERKAAYLEIKDFMSWFHKQFIPKVGEKRAYEWLRNSENPQAQAMVAYLKKWGKHSQKSLDYMKAQPWLTLYHDLPADQRQAWLDGNSEGAKTVRWYFDKYQSTFDLTQHGKDYIAIQGDLKSYFAMPKDKRTAWLEAGSPQATRVLAYFKKYGKAHQFTREFKALIAAYPALAHGTPEQARRMQFWSQYFAMTPDQRPAFVHRYAEDYGIFIYGDISETVRHDQEMEYDRRAVGLGISERAADFLYVRPLLTFYETLGKDDKQLFLKANPELQDYFDKYSTNSPTGDAKLDLLVEHYFLLPENSLLRSQMLKEHPEIQDFFDSKASPAVRAMRAVLEQYFKIRSPQARKDFMLTHPEIRDYFDQRKAEKASEREQLDAFEQSDPRLKPYFKSNEDMRRSADMMRRKLHGAAIRSLEDATAELQLRRVRQPAA